MTEYTYSITIQIEAGEAVDYWSEMNGAPIRLPLPVEMAIIGHACQDWRERRQDAIEAAAEAKLDAMGERG